MTDEDRDDLRATAENIVEDAERLKEIELRKLKLGQGHDEEANELAGRAEQLSQDIADKARAEKDIADRMADDT